MFHKENKLKKILFSSWNYLKIFKLYIINLKIKIQILFIKKNY